MPLPAGLDVLPTPSTPTVVQNATGAGAAITYQAVAVSFAGQDSIPSAGFTTPANNAATPNNTVTVSPVAGAAYYRLLKGGNLLATLAPGVLSFADNAGAAGTAYTAATVNPPAYAPTVDVPLDGQKLTWTFAILGLVPAASATDIFAIGGSATKTLRVLRLVVSALQTTAGSVDVQVIKRSGGTQAAGTAQTVVLNDTLNGAATGTVQTYTVNPGTVGTSLGAVAAAKLFVPAAATAFAPDKLILDYGVRPAQAQVLRGVAQFLCVNLNGVTVTGGSFDIFCEVTEE